MILIFKPEKGITELMCGVARIGKETFRKISYTGFFSPPQGKDDLANLF